MTLKYGNNELKNYYFRLITIEDELLPSYINDAIQNPSGMGDIFNRQFLEARTVILHGRIEADDKSTFNDRARALASMLAEVSGATDGSNKLYLPNREHYYIANLSGMSPMTPIMRTADVELEFYCPDPLAFGDTKTKSIPSTVTVDSDLFVLPTITVTFAGAASDYKVVDQTSGDEVEVIHEFQGGDVLVIDCKKQDVRLNNVSVMEKLTFASNFFKLRKGNNVITSTSPASLSYQERWFYA